MRLIPLLSILSILPFLGCEYNSEFELARTSECHQSGIFNIVTEHPSFPGGISEFYLFVASKLKYPDQARDLGIEGRVFVRFVILTDGTVGKVEAIEGPEEGGIREEAERVIRLSPQWEPGKSNGIPVCVQITLPITFKLG